MSLRKNFPALRGDRRSRCDYRTDEIMLVGDTDRHWCGMRSFHLTLFLGCLAALAPLAIETSLPAVPQIAEGLATSLSMTQWSFTGMFAGMAAGQLVVGPFCDRFGRRPALLWGLVALIVAGIGCALSPSVELLIAARALQGFGASVGVLISKAVPRDVWDGPAATSKLSFVTSISTAAMMCGPVVGSLILQATDWRGLFALLPAAGFLLLAVGWLRFPETLPPDKRHRASYLQRYWAVLSTRRSMLYFVANGCLFSAMIAFITGSPSVLLVTFRMDLLLYGLTYGLAVGCVTLGSFLNGLLAKRVAARVRLLMGVALALLALALLATLTIWSNASIVLLGGALFAASCGFNYPNSQAAGLSGVPQHAGVGAGVIGTSAYAMGAVSSGVIGFFGPGSVTTLVCVMFGFAVSGIALLVFLEAGRIADNRW
jgi:DHA1 family bicyclomycin/chloramphenicol resistance-like MFS transporter